ncbi:hypothetical protein phiK7B1_133 [Pseudomonas phage phiK7B1]|nr:hypothetical protein phiK7B1_133 [Pseudomonas phage phiK7B1]UIS24694.1 hypothetical protein S21ZY_132 [Pseudomonas phage ZY21]
MSDRMQAFIAEYRKLIEKFGYTIESAGLVAKMVESDYQDMREQCYEWLVDNLPEADHIA